MSADEGYLTLAEKHSIFTQFVCSADISTTVDIWEHITRTASVEVYALDFEKTAVLKLIEEREQASK